MVAGIPYFAVGTAVIGLLLAVAFSVLVRRGDPGNDRMQELSAAIREGAMAFLGREYRWIVVFVVVMGVVIFAVLDYGRPWGAIAYVAGAVASGLAGFAGMRIATAANSRTAEAARRGPGHALPLAFRGGAVMGFSVAGLGLLGISGAYLVFVQWLAVDDPFQVVAAFGLGASSIALFARIGGGIYTKAADLGADLVGKIEAGIPEDDPRNPATIADNVGDNVGDVAGMGADLFESYAGSLVAPIVLASLVFAGFGADLQERTFLFPLLIGGLGMVAAVIGAFTVRPHEGADLSRLLFRGINTAMVLGALLTVAGAYWLFGPVEEVTNPIWLAAAAILGLFAGSAIGFITEYFTSDSYAPVKRIAEQAQTGPATVIISGVAEGMLSVAPAILVVAAAVGGGFYFGGQAMPAVPESGLYGVALAAIGMLSTLGVVVSTDAYGPIADNAGGIAEMAELDPEVRRATDSLDSLGNTTAAVAKGFAIASAAITALALFRAFEAAVGIEVLDIGEVGVLIGLFLGAATPFVFAALTMKAVGRAGGTMIQEIRRQFRDIPGLREGREGVRPEYAKCVDISTQAALRQMVLPGSLAVLAPIVLGVISLHTLGGFLAGAVATGFLIAIFMSNAGGAWDNAKKYIEGGAYGGKGTEAHAAGVVGDTVGDPFKDTSGPAMNILIKVMTIVALVFAPAFL